MMKAAHPDSGGDPEPEVIPPEGDKVNDALKDVQGVLEHPMTWPRVTYGMYALSVVSGFPMIIGLIVAYVARSEAPHWLQTHYTFMIRTFWYFIVLAVVFTGLAALTLFLAWPLLMGILALWVAIRVIRGWMLLEDRKPVPNPESWLFG